MVGCGVVVKSPLLDLQNEKIFTSAVVFYFDLGMCKGPIICIGITSRDAELPMHIIGSWNLSQGDSEVIPPKRGALLMQVMFKL